MDTPTHYDIIDGKTGCKVGTAKTRAGATRSVDKRDNAYGAYRYRAVPVYATPAPKGWAVAETSVEA